MDLIRIVNCLLLTSVCLILPVAGAAQSADGKSRQTFADGSSYEGEWRNGKPHGEGVYRFADGSSYEGEWRNGAFDGRGTYRYADGSMYVGGWKNGKKQGYGVYSWADGRRYEGRWTNDSPADAKTLPGNRNVIVLSGAEAVRQGAKAGREIRDELDRRFEEFREAYSEANTAADADYLTRTEKDVLYYLNLARANPPLFADTYVSGYAGVPGVVKPYAFDERKQSLIKELKQLKALDLIYPSKEIHEYAECFARRSGERGTVGHERRGTSCPSDIYAECCDYGNNDGLLTVLDLLIDAGEHNAALGHRKLCLGEYGMAGVSVKPHVDAGYVCVINLGYNPDVVYTIGSYRGRVNIRGEYHGYGTYSYSNGDSYSGEWSKGKRNGKGVYRWANGAVYEGEWKEDRRSDTGLGNRQP